jgi:hypothetical protein
MTSPTEEAAMAEGDESTGADDVQTDDVGGDELGDAGKRAIQKEREAAKAAKKEARDAKSQVGKLQARLDELEAAGATEQEKAIREASKAAAAEVEAKYVGRIVASEVRIAAAKAGLTNPDDAVALLDLADLDIDADGFRDTVEAKIASLVEERPYLKGDGTRKIEGNGDGGAKPPKTLTDDKMTPQERLRAAYSN